MLMRFTSIAALLAILALADFGRGQQAPLTIPFEGPEVFCQILSHEGLRPVVSLEDLGADPLDTLLIVFGRPDQAGLDAVLENFLGQGGNLLFISDHPFTTKHVISRGWHVTQPAESAYGRLPACPWISSASGGDHPVFESLRRGIATNRPSDVFHRKMKFGPVALSPLVTLLEFPEDAVREEGRRLPVGGNEPPPLRYMVGSPRHAPPQGRMLFIAGQGMFMNGMMLQADNDNFDFAINAIRWLREAPDGKKRSKALLMVDGRIVTDFDMNLSPRASARPPHIPVPPVKAINRLIRGMEDEGLFHKIEQGMFGEHFDRVIGILITVATFVLLLYGAKKFLEARHVRETAAPRMVGVVAPMQPAAPRRQQRQQALQRRPDTTGAGQQLACAWLRAEFGIDPGQWSPDTRVDLRANGFMFARWLLQRRANGVLAIVRASPAGHLTRREFAGLVETLPRLSDAVRAGQLELFVDGKALRPGEPA
jgi:hypothetical protein